MNDDMLELSMWRDGNIMHENCIEDMKKLKAERDEAIKERDDSRWAAKYSIDALIKERDEARREVCNWSVGVGVKATNQAVAEERGWDCFKENNNG